MSLVLYETNMNKRSLKMEESVYSDFSDAGSTEDHLWVISFRGKNEELRKLIQSPGNQLDQ